MSEFTRFRKFVQKTPIGKLAEKGVAGQVLGAVMKKDKPAFNVGNPLERGYARGRAKAQELTGMTGKQVGQDTSHLVQQYKKRAFGDSESTRATQRRAQQRSERLARRGSIRFTVKITRI